MSNSVRLSFVYYKSKMKFELKRELDRMAPYSDKQIVFKEKYKLEFLEKY